MEIQEITYAEFLKENAQKYSEKIAICGDDCSYTYSEFDRITDAYAAKLIEMGIKPGDHVALWSYNCANWFATYVSIIKAGAVAVLMNYSLPVKDLADLMDLTDAKMIFYGRNRELDKDIDAAKKLCALSNLSEDKVINISGDAMDFKALLKENIDTSKVLELCKNDNPHRDAIIIFTTGTTSLPKAVLLSQFGVINDGNGYGDKYVEERGDSICNTLPMFHSFGLMVVTLYLHDARSVYLHEIIKPDEIVRVIDTYKTVDLSGVGAVYSALVEHPDFDIKVIPNIRICLIGGSVSTPTFMMRLEEKFTHATFLNGYGQTESSPALSMSSPTDPIEKRATSVGTLLPNAEIKIWTKEKGFMPDGEVGEVVARGYFLMNGYYKLPKEKQAIDDEGWLHTGDLGYLDEDGFLHLTGRIKDIIIKSGENISPVEIEQKIIENDAIKEVKVMGAPHPITSESVEACIVLNPGKTFDEEAMKAELKTKISKFKIPSHFFVFDEFPLSGNGKLDQRGLKELMLKRLKKLRLAHKVEKGHYVNKTIVKNDELAVAPVLGLIGTFIREIKFSEKRIKQILEAAKAMLDERIKNAYVDVGDITIELSLFTDFLRISFSDMGDKYFVEDNSSVETAKVILKNVSKYSTEKEEKGLSIYCLDFNWEDGFDIVDFLAENF